MQKMNPYIYLFALGHLAADWAQGAIPALLPYFIAAFKLNYQDAATLIFANILLSSFMQPIFGYYSDKISKPWFIPAGPLLCGICITIIGFSSSYWVIFFASMMCGVGSAIFHPEAALMVNGISGERKGQAMGTFSVGGNAGFALGPMVAGFCAYAFSIHGLIIFGIINTVIAVIIYINMSKVLSLAKNYEQKALAAHPDDVRQNDWKSFGELTVVILARSIGFSLCNTFIPIYWVDVLHSDAASGSFALTILFTLGAVITFVGGVLADRFGYIRIMRAAFLCMVPAMFFFTNSHNIWASTFLLVPVAFSLFAPYSPIVILGQSYLSKNVGFASGVTLGLSATLGGLVAPIVGWGADNWGIIPALQILWITGLAGAIFSFIVPKPHHLT
jgi:FSR family fosmidomycin resistance protein-like MFS transporter